MSAFALKGSFGAVSGPKPHTLILGTQPSDDSLNAGRYYNMNTNCLWYIVGDALGWQRGWADNKGNGPPPSITRCLLHDKVLNDYDEALRQLTSKHYALWDVLAESEREGSTDNKIKKESEKAANVRGFVEKHPTLERICLSSGATTADKFKFHFKSWLQEPGAFVVAPDEVSQKIFGKLVPTEKLTATGKKKPIELVVMESVSSAYVPKTACGISKTWATEEAAITGRREAYRKAGYEGLSRRASPYAWKRQRWFDVCFERESAVQLARGFGERSTDYADDEEVVVEERAAETTKAEKAPPSRGGKRKAPATASAEVEKEEEPLTQEAATRTMRRRPSVEKKKLSWADGTNSPAPSRERLHKKGRAMSQEEFGQ